LMLGMSLISSSHGRFLTIKIGTSLDSFLIVSCFM